MVLEISPSILHFLLLGLQLSISVCSPITSQRDGGLEELGNLQERQSGNSFFSVLGIGGLGDGSTHPRLEIRELEQNADQWNVYLLGLRRFQNMSQSDKLSYYQIAGIHGRPYIAWDGVQQVAGGFGGYCIHGSNIFPTWHRPYLALFEEILYLNARQVVSEFPSGPIKDRFTNALSTLRMPYWDWAAVPPSDQGTLPFSLRRPTVEVTLPSGTATIPNPLFSYTFHPLNKNDMGGSGNFATWPSTIRNPSSNDVNAASRIDLVANQMDSARPNLQSRVFNILSMHHDYGSISNDGSPGDSLESVHDAIHNTVGSGGHMGEVPFSAFDPIFWLHHTNIDRMLAIWQALNPDSYVTPMAQPYSTFSSPPQVVKDVNSPLQPFHRNDMGDFWTSETTRSTIAFGYTYTELVGLNGNDTPGLINRINTLYGPNATPQKRTILLTDGELVERSTLKSRGIAGAASFSLGRQYTANIKVRKFGLDGSFNVYVFLGEKPGSDPRKWISESSFVGMSGIFAAANPDSRKLKIEANGVVPLTPILETKVGTSQLQSLKEGVVGKYLKNNLRWRISTLDGKEILVENAPGFQLSILWSEVEPAKSASEFPKVVGDCHILMEATDGRPGGFQRGDTL
ncbi:Di-copper centre-containing protein [Lindgomyces ingoldianus]|uniref:Di-copper centre-containing protein n=1 Tax=Lindgomyces ingoldianus TaxID=673940 RepID=A0ACB6RG49_9PLEO|nr:Di-copper centre-containing protein [Lindgomyces ingoldianus]KAF2478091.1 Di-copper centre-containing protein [Lindgomyces ingoldianus]